MGNIVLVHDAWGGAWCWDAVAPELRGRGHEVRTPELHRGSLAGDTAAVQADVDELAGPAVVVGWSYGGMVITGLELSPGSRLVYVAAFMADDGETPFELGTRVSTALNEVIQPNEDGTVSLVGNGTAIDDALWADAPAAEAARARAALRPQAIAALTEPPGRIAWKDVPSAYLLCRQDRALHPDTQRAFAARASEVVEWDASHSPVLSRPAELAVLLDKLAS